MKTKITTLAATAACSAIAIVLGLYGQTTAATLFWVAAAIFGLALFAQLLFGRSKPAGAGNG